MCMESLSESSIVQRPRRNRVTAAIRALTQETHLLPQHLVAPLFVVLGKNQRQPIPSMPEVYRLSIDHLMEEVTELYSLGVRAINLFAAIPNEMKDPYGSEALNPDNLVCEAIRAIKEEIPEMCVMADVALDPYTSHGHDGLVDENGYVVNDATVDILAQMSVILAEAGVDIVAPSDMMDGRVGLIRAALDQAGFTNVGILSYAAKYASALYGPFRDALQSAPKFGDKKSYQLNPANRREAMRELVLDEMEGADMLMIKPATLYLDVIAEARSRTTLPIAAYHVSGEYSMVMAAAQQGWLDADRVFLENLLAIRRAGADFILTYAAKRIATLLTGQKK